MYNNNDYIDFFNRGQQKLEIYLYENCMPQDDEVYTLKNVMEGMNFDELLKRYSNKGRKGYNPIMIYSLLVYANIRGVREIDKVVKLCERDICFMWLSQGQKPKRDVFYNFINNRVTIEILEDLHYQYIRRLHKEGYLMLDTLFLDGTKIQANAGLYTFVWRGRLNHSLSNLIKKIAIAYEEYNKLIVKKDYAKKYNLSLEEMFILEGVDEINRVIEANKSRKLQKKKKLSNNSVITIENIYPRKLQSLSESIRYILNKENIEIVSGSGKRKSKTQKLMETFQELGEKLLEYSECFEILGDDRNSYSKTDNDATFMRMKEDKMMNGQLKAAYNLQFAVENNIIIHTYVSNDRTDYNTLIPIVEKHIKHFEDLLKSFIADSGYCSEKNLLYLKERGIDSFIKLQEHEKKKTRAYHQDIGKYYNMDSIMVENTDGEMEKAYVCHDGRLLRHTKTHKSIDKRDGFIKYYKVYDCESCAGCPHRKSCLNKYDPEKDEHKKKQMKVNERWYYLKSDSESNVLSDDGIINRMLRSIMTEGSFGDMKYNDKIQRFNHRSREKVYKEMLFYIIGRNLKKHHKFLNNSLKNCEKELRKKADLAA